MSTLNSSCKMKKLLILILLSAIYSFSYGQGQAELQAINSKSKTIYIKAEALDQLMISLRPFENKHGDGIDTLLMDTYLTISKGYAENNHFKQGYEVYNKYLSYKIASLQLYKSKTIATAASSINTRRQKDNAAQLELQNSINQLTIDIDDLGSDRSAFKKYFSLAIIILSLIFASMLVNYGIKFKNLKNTIKENKDSMLTNHRLGTLGRFAKGYQKETFKSIVATENTIAQIKSEIKSSTDPNFKKADQLCSSILKATSELKGINN